MADSSPKRVLLIDPNPAVHESVREMLSDIGNEELVEHGTVAATLHGVELDGVSDPGEGRARIRLAKDEGRPYLAAVVDLASAGGSDAGKTVRHLWDYDPELSFLLSAPYGFTTAQRRQVAEQLCRIDGFLFLSKPIDRYELLRLLNLLLDGRAARRELDRLGPALAALRGDLERTREEAELAGRAKNEFMANVSHEVRTPMNAILGFTRLLMKEPLTADQMEKLRYVDDAGTSLLGLINDVLDFSKLASGQLRLCPSAFDLDDLVRDLLEALRKQACQKKLALQCHVAAEVPRRLIGDRNRFRQILANLAGNAVKFTKEGSIHIRFALDEETDKTASLRVMVTDTGVGIPIQRQEVLFDDFAQADGSSTREFGGLGLGLAICKQLALLMEGQIGFRSNPDQGSSFWLTLTMGKQHCGIRNREDRTPRGEIHCQADVSTPDAAGNRPRVLVAEDDYLNRTLVEMLLGRAGCLVDPAATGSEALTLLGRTHYDLVLMDVEMPEMDGLDAIQRIRAQETISGEHVSIIALTARAMFEDRERCLAAGADTYLSKPIDPDALMEVVGQYLPELHYPSAPQSGNGRKDAPHTLHEYLAVLYDALQESNFQNLENSAGLLKNLSLKIGSKSVADHALRVQLAARNADLQQATSAIRRLQGVLQAQPAYPAEEETPTNSCPP